MEESQKGKKGGINKPAPGGIRTLNLLVFRLALQPLCCNHCPSIYWGTVFAV